MLAYIVKRLTKDHRVTWTDASEGGDEPWSFAFLENCGCRQARLGNTWLKFFKLLYHHTPQNACRAAESRYGPEDRTGPLRLMVDLAFSDTFSRKGLCRCRRKVVEFLIDRGDINVNGGRGTKLGTPLHTFCENVFRLQSRGWFEGGPHPWVGFREVLPYLDFLADKGCDVAALDENGRTARDWLIDGEKRMREGEGMGKWLPYLECKQDLYHQTKRALMFWPVNARAKRRWKFWIDLLDMVQEQLPA
ncbi:hypothetical protein PG997_012273 [Apiospora hydei]|uniref:Ankyrin repeat protein n=1 Tax=Apiospora hydei TaxID=1337664 RepID=A0ABR1V5E2_9PEZI